MADSKITGLTENTSPLTTDLLPMVDDPAGTPATQKMTIASLTNLLAVTSPINSNSMARQAIINGNCEIAQRGTSVALADVSTQFLIDHFADVTVDDGGTLPTLTRSQVAFTPGELDNSFYFSRLTSNGTGTSLGNSSYHRYQQKIEFGTRTLCGNGKKVTVSFWARSSIASKRIGVTLYQRYGSGGTPSTLEKILSTPITLTSTLTKYTVTFTTNTLSGKTFGTANDDSLDLIIYDQWGTTIGNTEVEASVSAETYGNGTLDIAQVQLCAGDVALPFMPKSFEEELRACQRYCWAYTSTAASEPIMIGPAASTTIAIGLLKLPVTMRVEPTLGSATATDWQLGDYVGANIDLNAIAVDNTSSTEVVQVRATVASGLTQYRNYYLISDGASRTIVLTAEL